MKKMTILQRVLIIFSVSLSVIVLFLSLKGGTGSGLEQAKGLTKVGQVFESSIARGRYGHIISLIEYGRWDLPEEIADFGAPDVAKGNGRFVSIWPPGVALILSVFYFIGAQFNAAQLLVGIGQILLTVLAWLLIYRLSLILKLKKPFAVFVGMIFVFATSAFAYTVTISQHILTTNFVLLLCIIAFSKDRLLKHVLAWLIYGLSVFVDLPNLILLLPLMVYIWFEDVVRIKLDKTKATVDVHYVLALTVVVILLPLFGLLKYNKTSSGNYFSFGQTMQRHTLNQQEQNNLTRRQDEKTLASPFSITKMPRGLATLTISQERGLLFYSPVLIASIFGLFKLSKKEPKKTRLIISLVIFNLLIYSMFGDVWGGWAFGPRYLIPSFALLSILSVYAFQLYGSRVLFSLVFYLLLIYSVIVNSLGAIGTTLIPPQHEATGLGLDYGLSVAVNFLQKNTLGSFLFNELFKQWLNVREYYFLMTALLLISIATFTVVLIPQIKNGKNNK